MIDFLNQACTLGNPKLVKFLLKHMEDKYGGEGVTNLLSHEDDDQNTPLHVCVESGSYESAKVSICAQEQLLKFCHTANIASKFMGQVAQYFVTESF